MEILSRLTKCNISANKEIIFSIEYILISRDDGVVIVECIYFSDASQNIFNFNIVDLDTFWILHKINDDVKYSYLFQMYAKPPNRIFFHHL